MNSVATKVPRAGCAPGTRLVRAGAVAFLAIIASWVIYALLSGRDAAFDPVDLTVYRDGGLIVRHVRPFFDPNANDPLYGWGGSTSLALKFTYTPFAALAFALVSFIPWTPLRILSIVVNVGCLLAALWFTLGALGYANRRVRLGAVLVAAAVTFWLQPVVRTIYLGQINLILMAVIMWDLCQPDYTKNGKRRWWKGVATGVAAGIKLVPLIFVPYLLITRKFREATATVAGFLATVIIGFIVLPHDSSKWWLHGMVLGDGNRAGFMGWAGNQSLRALITRLSGSVAAGQTPWIIASVLAVILGMTAALLLERAGYHVVAILATALTGLLVSPISWDHHWVWIVLVVVTAGHYAITAARRGAKRSARWLWLAVAGMILTFASWPDALWTKENLGRFSFGLLWLQQNTNPLQFSKYGDQPYYVEYHWHGFQLIWGNAYILGGMALLLLLLAIAYRVRKSNPVAEVSPQPPLPAGNQVPAPAPAPTPR